VTTAHRLTALRDVSLLGPRKLVQMAPILPSTWVSLRSERQTTMTRGEDTLNTKRLVVLGALLAVASAALADLKSDTQKQFNKYCVAVKNKDAQGIEKVLRANFAPGFKFVPKQGNSMDLTKWIADEKMQISMTDTVKAVSLHIDSVKMGKGAATMKVTLNYEGMAKIDPKGKFGLLKYVATSDQTMVQKNGKWWITEMKEAGSKTYFNGKPLGT
jgi:hypothetical protein